MANQIPTTGNTPAPTPRHNDVPQQITLSPIATIQLDNIRMMDGLYCLNDLHKMAGGSKKDTPSRFIRLDRTKGQIEAFERMEFAKNQKMGSAYHNPYMGSENPNQKMGSDNSPVIRVINGGDMQGVYACKPLMFAYTAWLDDDFHALVYNVFDRVTTGTTNYTAKLNALCRDLIDITELLAFCGRNLNIQGKHTKPAIQKEINDIMAIIQPQLPFTGE